MSQPQTSTAKLASACASIVSDASAMSRNVVESPEMSRNVRAKPENGKTNPTRNGPHSLSPRQLTAIGLLLAGNTAADAAKHLRINPRTIFRWKRDPSFIAEIERRADAMMPRVTPAARIGGAAQRPPTPPPAAPTRTMPRQPQQVVLSRQENERQDREDEAWVNEMMRRTFARAGMSQNVVKCPEMSRNVMAAGANGKTNPMRVR